MAGETFDLIVSNPPFIISPDNRHLFLNSGMDSDEVCRRLVKDADGFLNEGGYCVFNANWAVVDGEPWRDRLASWFAGTTCDGFVLHHNTSPIDEYAATFIEVGHDELAEHARLFDAWMDYYERRRIVGIGQGAIVMRRASGRPNWFATDFSPANISAPCGDDVVLLMELRTFLASVTNEQDLLDVRLGLAPNVRLEQTSAPRGGTWCQLSGRLTRIGGLEHSGSVDETSARLLARWDAERPVRAHLEELAGILGIDVTAVTPTALAIVRRLVEQGFLIPRAILEGGLRNSTARSLATVG